MGKVREVKGFLGIGNRFYEQGFFGEREIHASSVQRDILDRAVSVREGGKEWHRDIFNNLNGPHSVKTEDRRSSSYTAGPDYSRDSGPRESYDPSYEQSDSYFEDGTDTKPKPVPSSQPATSTRPQSSKTQLAPRAPRVLPKERTPGVSLSGRTTSTRTPQFQRVLPIPPIPPIHPIPPIPPIPPISALPPIPPIPPIPPMPPIPPIPPIPPLRW